MDDLSKFIEALTQIIDWERHDLVRAKVLDEADALGWEAYKDDKARWFLELPDERKERMWKAMQLRLPVKAKASRR